MNKLEPIFPDFPFTQKYNIISNFIVKSIPMNLHSRIQKADRNQYFTLKGYYVWDPSVIHDPSNGKYYLYGSRWPEEYGMGAWATDSRVFRAIGDTPVGPFTFVEEITSLNQHHWSQSMTHNPKVMKIGDTYCLYYIGTRWNEHGSKVRTDREIWRRVWCNKRIGVATSKSPAGPWIPCPHNPILDVRYDHWDSAITSNPTVFQNHGKIYMVYKSAKAHGVDRPVFNLGLCVSDVICGPYQRTGKSPLFDSDIEDPYIWTENGKFFMISKDMTGSVCGTLNAGIIYESEDASNWKLSDTPLAYDLSVSWTDGGKDEYFKAERPHLFLENGRSVCIYHAILPTQNGVSGILARRLST